MSLPPSSGIISQPGTSTSVPVHGLDENDHDVAAVLNDDPTVRALLEAAAAAAAAAAVAVSGVQTETPKATVDNTSTGSLIPPSVAADIIQRLIPSAARSSSLSPAPVVTHAALTPVSSPPQGTTPVPAVSTPSATTSPAVSTPTPAAASSSSPSASSSSPTSASSSMPRPFVSTKRFNPDDIFCLGCCRNLSVEHYTCPTTNRIFKSCNACRLKSRVNSKKVVKPPTIPNRPTISMEEFGQKLKDLENTPDKASSLDVMVRLGGSVEMDPETLKNRGALIAAQVYESTGYWFSHSRTNDETQAKTRLKIYGCSQREDRRAPPAPKTQSRKRNRPSTKAYFPCKGNLTMTFYQNVDNVRVVYNHKKHDKYDNRKCPDHVREYVKENLQLAPRVLFDNLMEQNKKLGITQAQVRYWSHYYKKSMDQDGLMDSSRGGSDDPDSPLAHDTIEQVMKDVASSQQQLAQQHHHQATAAPDHLDNDSVQQLLMASNAVALQNQALHSQAAALVGGSIAISVPMSDMPLSSSIVQRVLAEDGGKGLLELHASLSSVAGVSSSAVDNDEVVQQVSALLKENDQQLLEQQQKQLQEQQQQLQEHQHQQQQPSFQ
ncbi:hypothetical protein BGX23_000122 [Mortierella sp. AD031]|nr:hypothetical protein BGX23_000122 [Mortierella sp. AD031]KAG0201722.1 hypothetical protein BGX33_010149 [Mortierella sp. NVP41]